MKITEHFDSNEFLRECGCGRMNMKNSTIEHFEQFFGTLDGVDKIIVTSGIYNTGLRNRAYSGLRK